MAGGAHELTLIVDTANPSESKTDVVPPIALPWADGKCCCRKSIT
jgi:hypothetical protein